MIKRVDIYKANLHIIDDYRAYLNYGNTCSFKKKRKVIEMKRFYLIPLILCLFLGGPSCQQSQEAPKTEMEERVEKEPQPPMTEKGEKPETPVTEKGEKPE